MGNGIKIDDGDLKLDIQYVLESMSKDDQKAFIKSFACQSSVIEHVIDYICDEDPEGWWTSGSDEYRIKILERVEKTQLKRWSKYNWSFFEEAKNRLKEIRSRQELYWKLHHKLDEFGDLKVLNKYTDSEPDSLNWYIRKWMDANGIESNYTTKQADKDVERVEEIITEALNKMAESLPEDKQVEEK